MWILGLKGLICLDATKFALLGIVTLTETICPEICSKSWLKSAKSQLPDDVRRSKTLLLKVSQLCDRANRYMYQKSDRVPETAS